MQLTLPELTAALGFLGQARMLVAGVHSLFFNIGEAITAATLNDIDGRLGDEVQAIDRLIAATSTSSGQP